MDRLNFNHLYYFYIVAREGSIKEAALKLHVSQPTISDQIKLLEEYFNCKLFVREGRGLALSRDGKLALEYAQKLFDMSIELTGRLRNKEQLPKKSIDIGITHYMSQYFIYEKIIPLFEQQGLMVNIIENQRHLLLAELEEGNIDIVFTDDKNNILNTMDAYRIGVNKTFAVAHKKFKEYKKTFPECLSHIPFFNYTNNSTLKYEIELFFSKNGVSPKIIGEADDIDLFEVVTSKGYGFTIVPEVAKNRMCLNNEIIVLGELKEFQSSVWGIVKKTNKGISYSFLKDIK